MESKPTSTAATQNRGPQLADQYNRLRTELERLWSAPERDMVAIDKVMGELDATHAAFKAEHGPLAAHQRY